MAGFGSTKPKSGFASGSGFVLSGGLIGGGGGGSIRSSSGLDIVVILLAVVGVEPGGSTLVI
jgi:hypothetical protein